MTEAKRKKIVYVALVAAIIYGAVNFWPSGMKETVKPYPTIAPLAAQQAVLQKAKQSIGLSIDFAKYDSLRWGSDPFRATRNRSGPPNRAQPDRLICRA